MKTRLFVILLLFVGTLNAQSFTITRNKVTNQDGSVCETCGYDYQIYGQVESIDGLILTNVNTLHLGMKVRALYSCTILLCDTPRERPIVSFYFKKSTKGYINFYYPEPDSVIIQNNIVLEKNDPLYNVYKE